MRAGSSEKRPPMRTTGTYSAGRSARTRACSFRSPAPTWRPKPRRSWSRGRPCCTTRENPAGRNRTWPSSSRRKPRGRRGTCACRPTADSASPRSTTSSANSARRACTRSRPSRPTSCSAISPSTCCTFRVRIDRGESMLKVALRTAGLAAAFISVTVQAQDYPSRAVRMLVPNAPGSSIDTMSRIVAAKLGDALGQPVFVENRDGAGGLIGIEAGRTAKPDGYTLICASNGSMLIAPLLKKSVPYDAVKDFEHIGSFAVTPNVLIVHPDVPAKNVKELIEYARANRATINMSSAGVGSQSHLSGVLLMSMADFESLIVPHKGGGPSVNSVVAGQTHWTFTPAPAVMSFVKNGRVRALAHSLPRRSAMLGDIPPVADSVPGYDFSGWAGLVAPKGTSRPIIDKLHAALEKTLALPEVRDGLAKQGAEEFSGSPEDFRRFLAQDQANTVRVIKAAQLQAE